MLLGFMPIENPSEKRTMPSFNVSVPHELGQATARARVEQFLDAVQRDYAEHVRNVSGEWQENELNFRFVTSGLKISGSLAVEESVVEVSGPLPLVAVLFRGKIEQQIRAELAKLLS
jgi:hypothetical protein